MIDALALIPFSTDSSANQTGIGFGVLDLRDLKNLGDVINLQATVRTKNVGGGGGSLTLKFAQLPENMPIADIPAAQITSVAIPLPAASGARTMGQSGKLDQVGRFLHYWYDQTGLAAGCLLDIKLYINARVIPNS